MSSLHGFFEAMVIITYLIRHLDDGTGTRKRHARRRQVRSMRGQRWRRGAHRAT
ncbi:hypothetical protein [Plantactinospora sp. DSM 117369]